MEMVDAEYSELDNIPEMVVSLTTAVRVVVQGTGDGSSASTSRCNCNNNKGSTKRCPCKIVYNSCHIRNLILK